MLPLPEWDRIEQEIFLSALNSVALANKTELTPIESEFILAVGSIFFQLDIDGESLPTITPGELPRAFSTPEERQSLLSFCILMALVNETTDKQQERLLTEFESALALESPELHAFRDIADGRIQALTRTLDRRSFGERMRSSHQKSFPFHALSQRLKLRLGLPNTSLCRRYHALEALGPETLGRQYFEFIRSSGLSFPGEQNALSEHLVPHDLAHVLGGFGATPAEEVLVVAFQAACQEEGAFFSVLTAWCLFHLGIETSGARRVEVSRGEMSPQSFVSALMRGSECRIDFSGPWNFWPLLTRPVDEVRQQLGIRPRINAQSGAH